MNLSREYLSPEELVELNLVGNEEIISVDSWGGTFQFGEIWKLLNGREFYHVHDGMTSSVGYYNELGNSTKKD